MKSSLRACEVQPPGQGGIKILAAVWSPCEHAASVPAVRRVLRAFGAVHQQNGGHSSCMQILVRTVRTVQQTVDFHRYSSSMVVYAPVVVQRQVPWLGRAENCGVPQLPFLWGRAMLGSTMDSCSASSRVAFGRISRFSS